MALFKIPERNTGKDAIKEKLTKTTIRTSTGQSITISCSTSDLEKRIKMIVAYVDKELDPNGLRVVQDEAELLRYFEKIKEYGMASIDIEASSLDPITGTIAGFCFYVPGEDGIYVPCEHINYMTGAKYPNQISGRLIVDELLKFHTDILWVYHNSKFDIQYPKWSFGITMIPYWDTQIGAHLLNENEPHQLKYLHAKYIAKDMSKAKNNYSTLFGSLDFRLIPIRTAGLYAGRDTVITWELYEFQRQFLEPEHPKCIEKGLTDLAKLFLEIEMPLVSVVAEMENYGVSIDKPLADDLSARYHKALEFSKEKLYSEIAKLQPKIDALPHELRGCLDDPINLSSPKQIAIILYDVLRLKSPDKKSPRGTGADILEALRTETPVCEAMLAYRTVEKLLGTYIDKIPLEVKKKTGKLHAQFKQDKTVTGRFSSSDPNLQNIPSKNKDIRKMFVADPGYVFIGGDYSQQEPRMLAHMSGDENMINAYLNNQDIYASVASKVYKLPYEECLEFHPVTGVNQPDGKKRRDNMKPVILGIMYGRGEASIAEQLGISLEEARAIINDFNEAFPDVAKFVDSSQQKAREFGYVETAWGRKRRLPDMQKPDYEFSQKSGEVPQTVKDKYLKKLKKAWNNERSQIIAEAKKHGIFIKNNGGFIAQAERQCVNSIIQGSSADATKKALISLGTNERLKELDFHAIMTVHDEIIGTAPIENAKEASELMAKLMIEATTDRIKVPMAVDLEITDRWYGEAIKL